MRKSSDRIASALLTLTALTASPPAPAIAANLDMVEKNVEELDRVNREAVGQLPNLPRDGTVDFKAHVTMDGEKPRIRIEEKSILIQGGVVPTGGKDRSGVAISSPVTEGTLDFTDTNSRVDREKPGGKDVDQKNR